MIQMKTPLLIINFKVYSNSIENPINIANIVKKVSEETGIEIAIAPSHLTLKEVAKIIPTFAQSIDPFDPGQHTGSVVAEEVKKAGAIGAIINHSEKRLNTKDVEACVKMCKKNGLLSIVCVENPEEAKFYSSFNPDFIAIEPPELIGKYSVTQVNPKIVEDAVNSTHVKVLCGAGIKTKDDIKKALELGAVGVLVSSGVVKSENIEETLREAVKGMM
jgi:triosephosphate isomerase